MSAPNRSNDALLDMEYVNQMKPLYNKVIEQFPPDFGKAVSKRQREEEHLIASALIYGEIDFVSFAIALQKIVHIYGKPNVGHSPSVGVMQNRGGIFYDLGAGVGKPIFAAAILHHFDYCCGIEILEGLYTSSEQLLNVYNDKVKALLNRDIDTRIEFRHGDILDVASKDWRNGDVVFANSTCFDDGLMAQLGKLAVRMKKGSFFITLSKRLPSLDFVILEYAIYDASWGSATIYIQQKKTESREPDSESDEED